MRDRLPDLLLHFSLLDGLALLILLLCWFFCTFTIERRTAAKLSTHMLMEDYRIRWMEQMLTRQPRIFDSAILGIMRNGSTFFASSCMIAIGGCVALLGGAEQLTVIASDLSDALVVPKIVWEVKILVLMGFLGNGFLKFVWSVRLFGYCAIVMASVPNDPEDPEAMPTARKAADISNHAARSFNRGLRSVYFTIATLTWLIGPIPLIIAAITTTVVLYRREFNSRSRAALAA